MRLPEGVAVMAATTPISSTIPVKMAHLLFLLAADTRGSLTALGSDPGLISSDFLNPAAIVDSPFH